MKIRRILTVLVVAIVASASAAGQPRALGLRFGAGVEASYQHALPWLSFVEADLGLDYTGEPGMRASASWNFIIAEPRWSRGDWDFYLGPSVTLGYMNDRVKYSTLKDGTPLPGGAVKTTNDMGFAIGGGFQFGLEYTFWFPLQISLDIKPVFGGHRSGNEKFIEADGTEYICKGHWNFFQYGLWGFVPSLSVRYCF